ncbi:type IV pilus biogenesis/stability protein PilW [Salinivibrio sp. IB868]|uniref:type IV pilus biogenesis/stability protein PilW n=1 Tax=unclassified Salinivibrio TaxID=2636825 RepID=UPI0009855EF1|nr:MULTISPECIES: type IV pilus biogenesis/stability protein PilW [unclassified Salinivibrio]OOE64105.1 type IV pilus biogenesis/stability protein PilW [Salinivibrio sp. IB868]OOE77580.1 type IV pilus biogenesis/stability protein PilW [Salinivibrio sp. IB870]
MTKTVWVVGVLMALAGCSTPSSQHSEPKFDKIQAAEARIALGLGYLNSDRYQQAQQNLQQARQYAPNYYRTSLSMAYYQQRVGENDKADRLYQQALAQASEKGDVYNNYGVFLCEQQRFAAANDAFLQAVVQPYYHRVSDSYENAAFCQLKAGHVERAKALFSKAADHDPLNVRAGLQLAKLEIETGQEAAAVARIKRLHQRVGVQPAGLLLLVKAYQQQGYTERAAHDAQRLAQRFPESKEYQLYLANEY